MPPSTTSCVSSAGKEVIQPNILATEITENGGIKDKGKAAIWPQVWITLLIDIIPIISGGCCAFIAIYLPDIRNDSVIQASVEEGSWIASMALLGTIPGCFVAAWTSESLGRRRTLQLSVIPIIAGWILIHFATNVHTFYIAFLLSGFGDGINAGCKQVYLAEICDTRLRGLLSSTPVTGIQVGILTMFIVSLFIPWRDVVLGGGALAAVAFISFFFIPESPTWLVRKDRLDEAAEAMKFIRGDSYDIDSELKQVVERHHQNREERKATKGELMETIKAYLSPQTLKAFGILFLIFLTQRFSGFPVITNYTKDIFESALDGKFDSHYAAIISAVVRVVCTIASNFSLPSVGKKPLFGITGLGMAASLAVLATYDFVSENYGHFGHSWIPAVGVCSYMIFVTPGFMTTVWVLIGELFPQRTRGTMSAVLTSVGFLQYFVAVKTYPAFEGAVHFYGAFFIYTGVALVGTIVLVLVLPETKGKSLNEIEDKMRKVKTISQDVADDVV